MKEKLSDGTPLISHPPRNFVFYFDDPSNYIPSERNDFRFRFWPATTFVHNITFQGKWSITIVNSEYEWVLDEPEYAQQDSCSIVGSLEWMFRYSEYRKGNIFKLARGTPPARFTMPRTKTSIDELSAAMTKDRAPDQR